MMFISTSKQKQYILTPPPPYKCWVSPEFFVLLSSHCSTRVDQNLRQGIIMKTSFETRVSVMGLGSFVDINIFVKNIILFGFFILSFFSNLSNQNCTNVRPQKGNLGDSFNNTLLNFGLCSMARVQQVNSPLIYILFSLGFIRKTRRLNWVQ